MNVLIVDDQPEVVESMVSGVNWARIGGESLAIGTQFFRDLSIFYIFFGVSMVLRSVLEGVGDITCASLIGIGMLVVRIFFSYLLRPIFAERTIAFAEGFAWILMLCAFIWRIVHQHRRKHSHLVK